MYNLLWWKKLPLAGALIVTTPQDVALIDVESIKDCFKAGYPGVRIVENMSLHR